MTEKLAAYLLGSVLFLICFITCYRIYKTNLWVNGERYQQVGFMRYEGELEELYIPVYRRLKK